MAAVLCGAVVLLRSHAPTASFIMRNNVRTSLSLVFIPGEDKPLPASS